MKGEKLMTDRYKKILTYEVKISAKINKCHKIYNFVYSSDCETPYIDIDIY